MLKPLLTLLTVLALGYLALCGWFYVKQREFMYFPQHTRTDVAQTNLSLAVSGTTLRGWVVNPGGTHAIIYFGGNAESISAMRDELGRWFPDRSSYLVPYRGFGPNRGTPDEQTLQADALALFDLVQSRHPNGEIAVVGRSLGSGVASQLAAQRPVARLVLVTPFDSLVEVARAHYPWLPVRWLLKDRYDSLHHLAEYAGPILVMRAGDDQVVPAANTKRLVATLKARPRVVTLPDTDHDSISGDPAYARALVDFLNQ